MPLSPRVAAVVAALLLVATTAGPLRAQPIPFFDVAPGTILDKFGLEMSEQEAMERITFHPFVPTTTYTEVALLPAFHGDDKDHPENRGIGYEYPVGKIFYVLREWPRAGGSLETHYAAATYVGPKDCPHAYFTTGTPRHPRAFSWQTDTLVFTLQPDIPYGKNPDLPALRTEWERLAKRGICR
jgi:hypothetical protein